MPDYSDEELSGLSEEERAAITEDDEQVDEPEDRNVNIGPVEPEVGDEPEKPEVEEVIDEPEVDDEPEPEVEEPETDKEEPEPEKPEHETPIRRNEPIDTKLPDDVAQTFKAERDALNDKYENGDLTLAELLDGRDQISRRESKAETDHRETVIAANEWSAAQDEFFTKNEIYSKDKARFDKLNTFVKVIVSDNSEPTYQAVLKAAKEMEEFWHAKKNKVADPEPKPEPKKVKTKSPRPEAPNLGDLPASAPNSVDEGEFTALDKLSGLELEAAISKLSEAQLERYLKG